MDKSQITDVKAQTGGALWVAPAGTTLPTDATTALGSSFKQLGYTTKDGLVISEEREKESQDSWEADNVDSATKKVTKTAKFSPMEPFGIEGAKLVFGAANVTVSSGSDPQVTEITDNGGELGSCVLVAETIIKDGRKLRIVVADFAPNAVPELTFTRGTNLYPAVEGACQTDANGNCVKYLLSTPTSSSEG